MLAAVNDRPGQDQRGLATELGIDAASMSQIVDRLEAAGLVGRRVNLEDRRARELRVTAKGSRLRLRLRPTLLAAQQRILAPLAPDERALLLDFLSRIVAGNASYARPGNGRRKPGSKGLNPTNHAKRTK